MPLEAFFHHFPEIGKQETRTLTINGGALHGVPEGDYGFVEFYCTEQGCDCRRVMLQVVNSRDGIVAMISYGFDRNDDMAGPFLDPLHKHASYADALLNLTEQLLFGDPMYVARLQRHYGMMKEKVDRPAAQNRWWKQKPKKPGRPRRP